MITLEAFSVAVVQFVGINLGLNYDDLSNCYCPGTVCIMNPNAIKSSGLKFFSSCSMEDFKKSVSQPAFECLQNQKVPKVTYQGKASLCGNGILEQNEQCDCGLPKACTHKRCCNPADCTLIGYSECGSGPCCDSKTCMIASRGRLCRKSRDFCDFPEFCNGTSEFCVPDIKSADLEPCSNKTAYCLKGRCRDRDRQCLEIFGEFSKSGNYLCQEEINIHHDKFGNCREKCEFVNVFCGKLVCLWSSSDLSTPVAHDVQYMKLDGKICVSAAVRNATPENENTYVEDGSTCGDKKMCQSGRCVLISTYEQKPNCDSKVKCQGHGVCNDRLNCHCDAGYSPPSCDPVPDSPGGSIDDGFWLPTRNTILSFKSQRSAPTKGLLISLYIYIPLIVIITAIALKWNTLKKFWHRDELLSGGSVSEESIITSSESWSKSH
ncbi:A disintegrin and metallopeptidase domain 3-like [Ochotona princeps]|uniref:A disintegrin and metallopeptidase domain 3-like n=1 Tax=Ochotona princeps TaxID=9978 RepID=UPI0027145E9A|nr:A disintegrin and metallopeptidase domain 3-like [Ochotona princeps]